MQEYSCSNNCARFNQARDWRECECCWMDIGVVRIRMCNAYSLSHLWNTQLLFQMFHRTHMKSIHEPTQQQTANTENLLITVLTQHISQIHTK